VGIAAGKHVEIRDWGLLAVEVGQGEGAGHGRAWDLRIDIISGSNDCRIARLIGLGEECVRTGNGRRANEDYQREERLEAVVWVSGRVEGSHGRGRWVGGGTYVVIWRGVILQPWPLVRQGICPCGFEWMAAGAQI
jgi:hypothetical protein